MYFLSRAVSVFFWYALTISRAARMECVARCTSFMVSGLSFSPAGRFSSNSIRMVFTGTYACKAARRDKRSARASRPPIATSSSAQPFMAGPNKAPLSCTEYRV